MSNTVEPGSRRAAKRPVDTVQPGGGSQLKKKRNIGGFISTSPTSASFLRENAVAGPSTPRKISGTQGSVAPTRTSSRVSRPTQKKSAMLDLDLTSEPESDKTPPLVISQSPVASKRKSDDRKVPGTSSTASLKSRLSSVAIELSSDDDTSTKPPPKKRKLGSKPSPSTDVINLLDDDNISQKEITKSSPVKRAPPPQSKKTGHKVKSKKKSTKAPSKPPVKPEDVIEIPTTDDEDLPKPPLLSRSKPSALPPKPNGANSGTSPQSQTQPTQKFFSSGSQKRPAAPIIKPARIKTAPDAVAKPTSPRSDSLRLASPGVQDISCPNLLDSTLSSPLITVPDLVSTLGSPSPSIITSKIASPHPTSHTEVQGQAPNTLDLDTPVDSPIEPVVQDAMDANQLVIQVQAMQGQVEPEADLPQLDLSRSPSPPLSPPSVRDLDALDTMSRTQSLTTLPPLSLSPEPMTAAPPASLKTTTPVASTYPPGASAAIATPPLAAKSILVEEEPPLSEESRELPTQRRSEETSTVHEPTQMYFIRDSLPFEPLPAWASGPSAFRPAAPSYEIPSFSFRKFTIDELYAKDEVVRPPLVLWTDLIFGSALNILREKRLRERKLEEEKARRRAERLERRKGKEKEATLVASTPSQEDLPMEGLTKKSVILDETLASDVMHVDEPEKGNEGQHIEVIMVKESEDVVMATAEVSTQDTPAVPTVLNTPIPEASESTDANVVPRVGLQVQEDPRNRVLKLLRIRAAETFAQILKASEPSPQPPVRSAAPTMPSVPETSTATQATADESTPRKSETLSLCATPAPVVARPLPKTKLSPSEPLLDRELGRPQSPKPEEYINQNGAVRRKRGRPGKYSLATPSVPSINTACGGGNLNQSPLSQHVRVNSNAGVLERSTTMLDDVTGAPPPPAPEVCNELPALPSPRPPIEDEAKLVAKSQLLVHKLEEIKSLQVALSAPVPAAVLGVHPVVTPAIKRVDKSLSPLPSPATTSAFEVKVKPPYVLLEPPTQVDAEETLEEASVQAVLELDPTEEGYNICTEIATSSLKDIEMEEPGPPNVEQGIQDTTMVYQEPIEDLYQGDNACTASSVHATPQVPQDAREPRPASPSHTPPAPPTRASSAQDSSLGTPDISFSVSSVSSNTSSVTDDSVATPPPAIASEPLLKDEVSQKSFKYAFDVTVLDDPHITMEKLTLACQLDEDDLSGDYNDYAFYYI